MIYGLVWCKEGGNEKVSHIVKNSKIEKRKERRYNYVKRIILFGCTGSASLLRVIVPGIDRTVNLMHHSGVKQIPYIQMDGKQTRGTPIDLNLCVHDFQNWNLPIDGGLDDQLWVSERLFYQHLGIHVHVYCYIQLIENNKVCIVYQMHNNGIKFITN